MEEITRKGNYRQIIPRNTNGKILNKTLGNWIKQYRKRFTHHGQVGSSPGMQCWLHIWKSNNVIHHINRKNYTIITINAENALDEVQHIFTIKTLNKLGIKKNVLNQINGSFEKPTANIILDDERLNASS